MGLPEVVLFEVFKYLKTAELIDASAVCEKWRSVIWNGVFSEKVRETNQLFDDREWLVKTYRKSFDRFEFEVYWECISVLPKTAIDSIDNEVQRMFYGVLPNRVWFHFCFCSRSQLDLNTCQYCTMLPVRNAKINKYVNDKLNIDTRLFPILLRSSVLYVSEVHSFIHTNFGKDRQRPYSEDNSGTFYYEGVTSPFILFKSYLDIIGRLIFNFCDKNLLSVLFKDRRFCRSRIKAVNKIKENVFLFACKLIKRLVVSMCQSVNPNAAYEVYENYKFCVDYYNPYLSIDRQIQEKTE